MCDYYVKLFLVGEHLEVGMCLLQVEGSLD
jgi:hypothetical protein